MLGCTRYKSAGTRKRIESRIPRRNPQKSKKCLLGPAGRSNAQRGRVLPGPPRSNPTETARSVPPRPSRADARPTPPPCRRDLCHASRRRYSVGPVPPAAVVPPRRGRHSRPSALSREAAPSSPVERHPSPHVRSRGASSKLPSALQRRVAARRVVRRRPPAGPWAGTSRRPAPGPRPPIRCPWRGCRSPASPPSGAAGRLVAVARRVIASRRTPRSQPAAGSGAAEAAHPRVARHRPGWELRRSLGYPCRTSAEARERGCGVPASVAPPHAVPGAAPRGARLPLLVLAVAQARLSERRARHRVLLRTSVFSSFPPVRVRAGALSCAPLGPLRWRGRHPGGRRPGRSTRTELWPPPPGVRRRARLG